MVEIEKLGQKYCFVALRISKDPQFDQLSCIHRGTYAIDCVVQRLGDSVQMLPCRHS